MGKSANWFRRLFGGNKPAGSGGSTDSRRTKERKRWGLVRSFKDNDRTAMPAPSPQPCQATSAGVYADADDANKHAIAVAAATAAVAEAALAAAQAAAAVVRLTSSGGRCTTPAHVSGGGRRREDLAAVKIQSAFRAYLARRALRALKALVKLQALVRGHIVRKQTADMLRRMQALVRVQARARANRAQMSESSHSTITTNSLPHHTGSPIKYMQQFHTNSTKLDRSSILKRCGSNSNIRDAISQAEDHMGQDWLDQWIEDYSWNHHRNTGSLKTWHVDEEKSDKILEVDTERPHFKSKGSNRAFQSPHHVLASDYSNHSYATVDSPSKYPARIHKPIPSLSSREALSLSSAKFPEEADEEALYTAENSPQVFSASSRLGSSSSTRRGPFTPGRSECSRSLFDGYLDYPNYMANTESSRAKARSQSAPRQRIEFENPGSRRSSGHGVWDAGTNSHRGWALQADSRNRDYTFSGRLDRLLSSSLR